MLSLFVSILLASIPSHARIFDFTKSTSSTYLKGDYGFNRVQKMAYQPGFPSAISFPSLGGVSQNFAAEIGFGINVHKFTTRFGLQLLFPQLMTGLAGTSASGTQLLSVTSQLYAIIPKVDFEVALKQTAETKTYLGFGLGYAFVTLRNSVGFTPSGNAAYPGVSDYIETGATNALMVEAYGGVEYLLFDTVGFGLDAGYQYLPVGSINVSQSSTTISGAETSGGVMKNADGSSRNFDLSNIFAAASLRIYFN